MSDYSFVAGSIEHRQAEIDYCRSMIAGHRASADYWRTAATAAGTTALTADRYRSYASQEVAMAAAYGRRMALAAAALEHALAAQASGAHA